MPKYKDPKYKGPKHKDSPRHPTTKYERMHNTIAMMVARGLTDDEIHSVLVVVTEAHEVRDGLFWHEKERALKDARAGA